MKNLPELEDTFIIKAQWQTLDCLEIHVEDFDGEEQTKVIFYGIKYSKMLVSSSTGLCIENEIWKAEEVAESEIIDGIVEDNGFYWMKQNFGSRYQAVPSAKDKDSLKHTVIMSDSLSIELVCERYEMI